MPTSHAGKRATAVERWPGRRASNRSGNSSLAVLPKRITILHVCDQPFSRRHQYVGDPTEITIREGAPESLRVAVLEAVRALRWSPRRIRQVLCGVLRVRPDVGNWSDQNIWDEIDHLIHNLNACPWFRVYDFIEAVHREIAATRAMTGGAGDEDHQFATAINACFLEEGIGWQLTEEGQIVTRGTEAFETVVGGAVDALNETNRPTAAGCVHAAVRALSLRPTADLRGAINNAMGALEAVARDVTGDDQATLGQIITRNPQLLPTQPLRSAASQLWGYASNEARHVREGPEPQREDAELVVGLAAVLVTYLTRQRVTGAAHP